MGAAASTVYYDLKLRYPTLDMPIIDYDLALLIQPMLMLGLRIGVAFNVIFADWMAHRPKPSFEGKRVISSKGTDDSNLRVHQLILYCSCGVLAGMVGGLLGLGGGFIMGPLFLELGVPPQVSGVGISNMIVKIEDQDYMGFENLCKYEA
ncbi:hypothetical protein RJ640_012492 [Escallonia rubra]|uniref:Sulfite exporter TauE/SafE family protein n=1 Tax=Escallonia rubra TaxID=112253 RepID=A0AA88QNN9_9ASTE|nr:hypothetical protein RJ640_012492 [Escallonia rubra]